MLFVEWAHFMSSLATRICSLFSCRERLYAACRVALEAGSAGVAGAADAEDVARSLPDEQLLDPFSALGRIAGCADPVRALRALAEELGLSLAPQGADVMAPLEGGPVFCAAGEGRADAAFSDALWDLFACAIDVAELGRLTGVATGRERTDFVDALDLVLAKKSPACTLSRIATVLSWCEPHSYLPLDAPTRALLTSRDGLGIDEEDLPGGAREYLALLSFLDDEMAAARLPYRDFLELHHAACEGRSLAEGLCDEDRADLLEREVAPLLRRLWPRDDERVQAELERLSS